MVSDDALAAAGVRIWHDANADGRVDFNEAQAGLSTSGAGALRGQFAISPNISQAFAGSHGVLQFTSTGGSTTVLGQEVAIAGPVQYMAYLTHPIVDSDAHFQVVLSPLSTLASHLFRTTLAQGTPARFDADERYAEDLAFVAATVGVPMQAQQLMSIAPEQSSVQRIIAERQMNALLNVLVTLSSGKGDASDGALSVQATADIGQRLATYLVNHGGLDPADPSQLRLLIASVLPEAVAIGDALAASLAPLMSAFAFAADGDDGMSRAAQALVPKFAQLMVATHAAMTNGTLATPATQTQLITQLNQLRSELPGTLADGAPVAHARVIVNDSGAFIDQNTDGRLDDADKVGGALVAANFGAGGNASLAANRVVITWQGLPVTAQIAAMSALTTDDQVVFNLDSANYGNAFDRKWTAADANSLLNAVQDKGIKAGISLTARGLGSIAKFSIGKLPEIDTTQGLTAQVGALSVRAFGNMNGSFASEASLIVGLGGAVPGNISGPVSVQAAGAGSKATMTAISNSGLVAGEIAVVVTGSNAAARASLKSSADKSLDTGALSSVSHAAGSKAALLMEGGKGGAAAASVTATAAGAGATSTLDMTAADGGLRIGTSIGATFTPGDVIVVASGSVLVSGGQTLANEARAHLVASGGNTSIGALQTIASGMGSTASVVIRSDKGMTAVNGSTALEARGAQSAASLMLSGQSSGSSPAVQMTGLSQVASGAQSAALTDITADSGSIRLSGNLDLMASGDGGLATIKMALSDAMLSVGGNWTQTASGNGTRANVLVGSAGGPAVGMNVGGVLTLQVDGSGSTATMSYLPTGTSVVARDIGIAGVVLNADADQLTANDQIALSLVTAGGKFVDAGSLGIVARGSNARIATELGSHSGLVDILAMQQAAEGSGSQIRTSVVAGDALNFGRSVSLQASGAFAYSGTTFDAAKALLVGGPLADAPNLLRVLSTGYGTGTELKLNMDGANVTLDGAVHLVRSGAAGRLTGANNFTRLIFSDQTQNVHITGPLEMVADTSAIDGQVQAELRSASGQMSIGSVSLLSLGFNVDTRLNAQVTSAPDSTAPTRFIVEGDFAVTSASSNLTGSTNQKTEATILVAGRESSFDVGGKLSVEAVGDFVGADASFDVQSEASTAVSHIRGMVEVKAEGTGSHASASLAGAAALAIGGDIHVESVGLGAAAIFTARNLSGFNGAVQVSANAAQTSGSVGAFAYLGLQDLSQLSAQTWVVDPVQSLDRAVLDIGTASYGGIVQLGLTGSLGSAYLRLYDALVSEVHVGAALSRGVIALSMPDADLLTEVAKSSVMTVSGFKEGIDKFVFNFPDLTQAWQGGEVVVAPGSIDAQLDAFLNTATGRLLGKTQGGFVTSNIGGDEYIAFDYDGVGLTGLIRLAGVGSVVPGSGLVASIPVPDDLGVNLSTLPLIAVVDPNSNPTIVGESINKGSLLVSAQAFEHTTLTLTTRDFLLPTLGGVNISSESLTVDSSGYRGQAKAFLTAGGHNSGIAVNGALSIRANALSGLARVGAQCERDMLITGSFIAAANAVQSQSQFNATVGDLLQFNSGVSVNATAAYSDAQMNLSGVAQAFSIGSRVYMDKDVAVKSIGFRSSATVDIEHKYFGKWQVGGPLSIDATGDESTASLSDQLGYGTVTLAGDTLVRARGVGATANFNIHDSAPSGETSIRTHSLAGKLTADASGVRSSVVVEIALSTESDLSFGGAISAIASAEQAAADLGVSMKAGTIVLPTLSVDASGLQSRATGNLSIGAAASDSSSVAPSDNLSISGLLSISASALDAHAAVNLGVFNGDVEVGGLVIDALMPATAQGSIGAGATRYDAESGVNLNAGVGALSFVGDVSVQARGAGSMANGLALSHNDTLRFGGLIKVVAGGTNSSAAFGAHALSNEIMAGDFYIPGIVPPPASLITTGGLTVAASNFGAQAQANLSSSWGELRIGGNLNLLASAERSLSSTQMLAAGANIFLMGDLTALSSGEASTTELNASVERRENVQSSTNLLGQVEIAGAVSLAAMGTNAVTNVTLQSEFDHGVKIGKGVSVNAGGVGALATLSLSGTQELPRSEPIMAIAGVVALAASAASSTSAATFTVMHGDVSIGGLSMVASGSQSHANFIAMASDALSLGGVGVQVRANGYGSTAEVALSSSTGALTVAGGVSLIASGDASSIDASLVSTSASVTVAKDVSAMSLADGSAVNLTLSQGSASAVSVTGQIRLIADSGSGSVSGATVAGTLGLGKLGAANTDLLMDAVQTGDRADASLRLAVDGGGVRLGSAAHHGTVALTLTGDNAAAGNQLVDTIAIDFTGTSGQAIVRFDADQDNVGANLLPVVTVKGFRLDADGLHFGNLQGVESEFALPTLGAFTAAALEHFNTGGAAAAPVSGIFAGGSNGLDKTFIAYDIDGIGVTAIIELDGVSLDEFMKNYQTANGLG